MKNYSGNSIIKIYNLEDFWLIEEMKLKRIILFEDSEIGILGG